VGFRVHADAPTKVLRNYLAGWDTGCAKLLGKPLRESLPMDPRVGLFVFSWHNRKGRRLKLKERTLLHDA
jgi:hypothetical protein